MKCYYHPEVEAADICTNCGKAICESDSVNVADKIVCKSCLSTGNLAKDATTKPSVPTNPLAVVSIGSGVIGFMGCCCFGILGIIFGVLAAVTGYMARKQILESSEPQQGEQLATIGMILGVAEVALGLILFFVMISFYGIGFFAEFVDQILQYQ